MRLEHAYIKLNGQEYRDYTLYIGNDNNLDVNELYSDYFVVSDFFADKLCCEIEQFTDATIFPKKHSDIYITPKCPYPIDDIRQNYKVKRHPDSGDYNVIAPMSRTLIKQCVYGYSVAVFPSLQSVYARRSSNRCTETELYREALLYITNADFNDMVCKISDFCTRFSIISGANIYRQLLDGALSKPCVPYTNLDIAGANQLTEDVLTLVYRAGSMPCYEKDVEKNFIMQLNVLNQHNWREYPGTLSILFGQMLERDTNNIFNDIKDHKSRYSKVVKELLSCRNKNFASEKDFNFSRDWVNSMLNIGDCRFTTIQDLTSKLYEIQINWNTFYKLYNNMVRITPKKYGE